MNTWKPKQFTISKKGEREREIYRNKTKYVQGFIH